MKRMLFTVCILGIILSSNLLAQNWNEEQQQILERVKTGWTLWQEAVLKKDYSIWLNGFEPCDDWQGWWITDGGLWNTEAEKRTFDNQVKRLKDFYWEIVQPLSIQVYDDMALIYFYVTFNEQDQDGKWVRLINKRLEVYRKLNGKWRWLGCMAAGKEIGPFFETK